MDYQDVLDKGIMSRTQCQNISKDWDKWFMFNVVGFIMERSILKISYMSGDEEMWDN